MPFVCRETADVAVAKAIFSSFRERFTKLAEFALAMSSHSQDKAELIQNLSLEELFRANPQIPRLALTFELYVRCLTRSLLHAVYEGTSAAAYQAQAWCFDHDLNTAEFQKH